MPGRGPPAGLAGGGGIPKGVPEGVTTPGGVEMPYAAGKLGGGLKLLLGGAVAWNVDTARKLTLGSEPTDS